MTDYKFHELTETFAAPADEEFEALIEDIRQRGLYEPITLHEGEIVDGRTRYLACK